MAGTHKTSCNFEASGLKYSKPWVVLHGKVPWIHGWLLLLGDFTGFVFCFKCWPLKWNIYIFFFQLMAEKIHPCFVLENIAMARNRKFEIIQKKKSNKFSLLYSDVKKNLRTVARPFFSQQSCWGQSFIDFWVWCFGVSSLPIAVRWMGISRLAIRALLVHFWELKTVSLKEKFKLCRPNCARHFSSPFRLRQHWEKSGKTCAFFGSQQGGNIQLCNCCTLQK